MPSASAEATTAADSLGFRDALATGGLRTVAILGGLALFDEFDNAILGVFAPDIQDALGISTTALAVVATASGAVYVAGAIPLARLADRSDRRRIVVVATLLWAVATAALALVRNAFQFVVARVVTGFGKSHALPVHGSILADAYPERARGAVFAIQGTAAPLGRVLAPLTIAGLTTVFTGDDAWRTISVLLVLPAVAMALIAWRRLPEPPRGQFERERVLGEVHDVPDAQPMAVELAFARIRRIATFDRLATGIGAIGFTIFSVPIFISLVLEDTYGLDAGERSLVNTAAALASLVAVPIGASYGGRVFRENPRRLLVLMAGAVVGASACTSGAVFMPNAATLTIAFALGGALGAGAFVMLSVIVASIVPPELRAQGFSLLGVYVFLVGGFFGSIVAGIVADSIGTRSAIPAVVLPAAAIGARLIARAGETIDDDMQRVADDLVEAAEEHERRRRAAGSDPVLQVKHLDVSIGHVPILHGIDLEVRRGEIVGLVGTNGAGKSTLLRAISGLQVADRGVIRFGPTDVTLQAAHQRTRAGIVQLSGGRSSFGPLSVRENFEVGGLHVDPGDRAARVARSLALFPELEPMLDRRADRLSGGEQQMLGLARTLLLDPELLLIDELSLGLAPVVVGRLVEAIDAIRRDGTAVVIVEQSLNIAASAADRVVFLDRGRVVFEGAGRELLERRDLARSVFLGGDT